MTAAPPGAPVGGCALLNGWRAGRSCGSAAGARRVSRRRRAGRRPRPPAFSQVSTPGPGSGRRAAGACARRHRRRSGARGPRLTCWRHARPPGAAGAPGARPVAAPALLPRGGAPEPGGRPFHRCEGCRAEGGRRARGRREAEAPGCRRPPPPVGRAWVTESRRETGAPRRGAGGSSAVFVCF